MKANELRIGNIVTHEGRYHYTINDGCDIDASSIFSPIPLTEEWLLKFGFGKKSINRQMAFCKKNPNSVAEYRFYLNSISNIIEYVSVNYNVDSYCNEYAIAWDFKYVHQLQNIYFSLTGEELTIKE